MQVRPRGPRHPPQRTSEHPGAVRLRGAQPLHGRRNRRSHPIQRITEGKIKIMPEQEKFLIDWLQGNDSEKERSDVGFKIKKEIYESLARLLCAHAQEFNYDHGPNPTLEWPVGACPRHIQMAYGIIR